MNKKEHNWEGVGMYHNNVGNLKLASFCLDCGIFNSPKTSAFACPPWAAHESGGITNAGRVCEGVDVHFLKELYEFIDSNIENGFYDAVNPSPYADAIDLRERLLNLIRTHEGQAGD